MNRLVAGVPLVALSLLVGSVMAATFFGVSVADSHNATNPENILDGDQDFAVLRGGDVSRCPKGDITLVANTCRENDSNKTFVGWIVVNMTNTSQPIANVTTLEFLVSELNLGCTVCNASGNQSAGFRVFGTSDFIGSSTNWQFVGNCAVADDEQNKTCSFSPNGTVDLESYLVGRAAYGDEFPDPAIHWGKAIT